MVDILSSANDDDQQIVMEVLASDFEEDAEAAAERLAAEVILEVLASAPVRERGEREEWAQHVGWHYKEDPHAPADKPVATAAAPVSASADVSAASEDETMERQQQKQGRRRRLHRGEAKTADERAGQKKEGGRKEEGSYRSQGKKGHRQEHKRDTKSEETCKRGNIRRSVMPPGMAL